MYAFAKPDLTICSGLFIRLSAGFFWFHTLICVKPPIVNGREFARYIILWLGLAALVGILSGSASAVFLIVLDWVTELREAQVGLLVFLPMAGFAIGYVYHRYGAESSGGNNLLLEELYQNQRSIPLRLIPLVFFGTILTHLFGGSAGREGTAVQMGGSLADQLARGVSLSGDYRRLILICGVAGGFASVFGTPFAGAIFSLEWMLNRKFRWQSLFPAIWSAIVANWICETIWGVGHTDYFIPEVPIHSIQNLAWVIPAGIAFGLCARLFAETGRRVGDLFKWGIVYPPFRPMIGGAVVALLVYFTGTTTYLGLGIPRIVEAFEVPLPWYDWLAKTGLTGLTLGSGFKGGEVTPLFFTGATLGNALSAWIPLPLALLAGMGFVGVFSGASNTPLASTVLGLELFGVETGIFLGLACLTAFLSSGKGGIYSSQKIEFKYSWRF